MEERLQRKNCGCVVKNLPNGPPHLGLPYISPIGPPEGRAGRYAQIGTKDKEQSISWTLPITYRVSGFNSKHQNWEYLPPVPCGI